MDNQIKLLRACQYEKLDDVKLCISEGADPVSAFDEERGFYAVHCAVQGSRLDIVRFLLEECKGKIEIYTRAHDYDFI